MIYVYGDDSTSKQCVFIEKFALRHCYFESSLIKHINNKTNTRRFIKQIVSNVLCWIFALKLLF